MQHRTEGTNEHEQGAVDSREVKRHINDHLQRGRRKPDRGRQKTTSSEEIGMTDAPLSSQSGADSTVLAGHQGNPAYHSEHQLPGAGGAECGARVS
jgi:hypothetical protein